MTATLGLAAAPAALADTTSAADDGTLSEVVVVAQKRAESSQSVPISISAFSAATLADANVTNLQGITTLDSSLVIGEGTGQAVPFLRGIGNPVRNIGDEASTSIYVDGVYYSRIPAALFELNNIAQVEILKGPQGTLFGRNSEGGLVNIITRDPTQTPVLEASAGYGNFETSRGSLYAATGLGEKAAIDLSVLEVHQNQGWGTDLVTGGKNGFEDINAIRSKLVLQPADGTVVKLSADYIDTKSTDGLSSNAYRGTNQGPPIPSVPPQPLPSIPFYDTQNNVNNLADETSWSVASNVRQDLGFADFVSITAFRRAYESILQDGDDSPLDYSVAQINDYSRQTSQEFQILSKNSSAIDWIGGLYYLHQAGAYTPVSEYGSHYGSSTIDIFSTAEDSSYAGYGQATLPVVAELKLTLGVRYTRDDVSGSGHTDIVSPAVTEAGAVSAASKTFDKITYKAALNYQVNDATIAYVSYSTGFKAGVFASLPFSATPVAPESIRAYEIGEKTELFDHRLRLNAAAFHYEIANLQVQAVVTEPTLELLLVNAPRAHSTGLDLNGEAIVTPDFTATFGATLLDAKFDTFPDAPSYMPVLPYGNGPLTEVNADGNYLPRSPRLAFNLGGNYKLSTDFGVWRFGANYAYTAHYYWDPDNLHQQSAVGLLDANVGYSPRRDDRWTFRLWGKNLTDEHYYWGENEASGSEGTPGVVAPPRTFGISADFKL